MLDVYLFAEDVGHELVVGALVRRIAADAGVAVAVHPQSVRGGYGRTILALRQYTSAVRRGRQPIPDVLVVATDADRSGHAERLRAIRDAAGAELADRLVCAIPEPHVERWLLVDGRAFRVAVGRGCSAPDQKWGRDRYKQLLAQAVRDAGRPVVLEGLEHAGAIVAAMDLQAAAQADDQLGKFLDSLRSALARLAGVTDKED